MRRSELDSPSSSRSTSPAPYALEYFKSRALSFSDHVTAPAPVPVEEESEAEFNLFSRPAGSKTVIKLRSPSPDSADNATFLRPQSFYIREPLTTDEEAEYASAALSGADILRLAKVERPGSAYAWKVITIPASRVHGADNGAPTERNKKQRLGKKGRIKLRRKGEANKERKGQQEAQKAEKELEERKKRAQRNREKKLKKRARDKAKKAATKGEEGIDHGSVSGSEEE